MSYEGRIICICPKGHLNEFDYQDYYMDSSDLNPNEEIYDIHKCEICNQDLKFVGQVDDTNGESSARFYKKLIMKGSRKKEYHPVTDKMTITIVPDIYEIEYGDGEEWFNFDTGEKLP